MNLPNGEQALVDIAKLSDYCLNPEHPRGRHKARVFRAALDMGPEDAHLLRDALLHAARSMGVIQGERDAYGQRFVLDFDLEGRSGSVQIRSTWIVRTGEDIPRLTSCFVL